MIRYAILNIGIITGDEMENKSNLMHVLIYLYVFLIPLIPSGLKLAHIPISGDLILALIILTYLYRVITSKDARRKLIYVIRNFYVNYFEVAMLVLLIVMVGSTAYAHEKKLALSESFRFFTYIVLYFIVKLECSDKKIIKNILNVYISICTFVSLLGIIQYFTGIGLDKKFTGYAYAKEKISATLDNPNNLAAFVMLAIFPVIMVAIYEKNKKKKMLYLGSFTLLLINLVLTTSRNGIIGIFVGLVVLGLVYNWKALFSLIIFGCGALFIPAISARIKDMTNYDQNQSRIYLWQIALKMIKDHPVRGVGNGNYVSLYDTYVKKYPEYAYYGYTRFPSHNSYLKVQSELGILGSLPFIAILIISVKNIGDVIKFSRDSFLKYYYTGFMASAISFFVMNLFDNLFFIPKTVSYFWLVLALAEALKLSDNRI